MWFQLVYTGIGVWLGTYLNPVLETMQKLYHTFQQQQCSNTILPEKLEPYVPGPVINTLEMGKFMVEQLWIHLEQILRKSCIKSGNVYHIHCIIENKRYSVILKPERGPEPEYIFEEENGYNCTERVNAYLRGAGAVVQKITPERLGYTKLFKHIEGNSLGRYDSKELLKPI
jgi:hypothetical protein